MSNAGAFFSLALNAYACYATVTHNALRMHVSMHISTTMYNRRSFSLINQGISRSTEN